MRTSLIVLAIAGMLITNARAQSGDSLKVEWSAFIDSYYMYDFNSLPDNVASHPFTQPLRNNEFNLNLAHFEARVISRDVRGVLSVHTGTSVKATYAGESNNRELSQLIHEAWAGYQLATGLWIDAGIFAAPYTQEVWLTKDNKTYTHSILAEFVPFYQAGVRAFWQPVETFNATGYAINGWQNIAETNRDKAVGLSLAFSPISYVSFAYNNFVGNEQPAGQPSALRIFNDICLRIGEEGKVQADLTYDFGTENKDSADRVWMGAAIVARVPLGDKIAFGVRGEYYKDQYQIIYHTAGTDGFDGYGASLNFDVRPGKGLLWRTEGRYIRSKTDVFPSDRGLLNHTAFVVSSLSLGF
ncbi:MAG: outer membrane beta-barrel protein [Ignavibacteriota bacterium]